MRNIAIVGTAPHWSEAPFDKPDWEIWVCSPANIGRVPRWDRWYEIHDLDYLKANGAFGEAHDAFLKQDHGRPIVMNRAYAEVPNCVPLDKERLVETFGEFFLTSSFAYMMGDAILKAPEKIGLWGVDCAATGEFYEQRPGAQFFMEMCRQRGIKVVLPSASLLTVRVAHYGIERPSRAEIAMRKRLGKLQANLEEAKERHRIAVRDVNVITGAITVLEDILNAEVGGTSHIIGDGA